MIKQENFIARAIIFLRQNTILNFVFVLLYFLLVIFIHNPLVLLSIFIESQLGIYGYNILVAVCFILLIAAGMYYLYTQAKSSTSSKRIAYTYGTATLLLAIVHSRFMLDSNIEIVHALGYAGLVFLIFPLVNRFGAAVLFALPFMLFDEWYQYTILYPDAIDYFDFNDVLMDTYGCAITMVIVMLLGVRATKPIPVLWKRVEFIALCAMVVLVFCLLQIGIISLFVSNNAWLVLNENSIEPFWRYHQAHKIYYHAMQPLEAIVAITALHLFYLGMDRSDTKT